MVNLLSPPPALQAIGPGQSEHPHAGKDQAWVPFGLPPTAFGAAVNASSLDVALGIGLTMAAMFIQAIRLILEESLLAELAMHPMQVCCVM